MEQKNGFRCGPKGNPKFRGETRYLDIAPNARVVSSETVDVDGQRLAVALTTLNFEPTEGGTNLTLTIQMVSFVGPDGRAHTRGQKLLCGSRVRELVAVGEGRQERDKGIFLLVCELKVAELSFVEVG